MNRLNRHDEQQVAGEVDALGERPGDQRRRDDRELQLEQREQQQRDRRRQRRMRRAADAVEHEEGERVADQPVVAVAEREAEADHHPQHRDDAERDDALEHRGDDVLEADHAAVEERQAGRHQEDERRGGQHPGDVARIDRRGRLRRRGGRAHGRHEQRRQGDQDQEKERQSRALHGIIPLRGWARASEQVD